MMNAGCMSKIMIKKKKITFKIETSRGQGDLSQKQVPWAMELSPVWTDKRALPLIGEVAVLLELLGLPAN